MPTPRPKSAPVLEKALARTGGQLTVADAAAQAGVPLRDAEEGLRWLAAEFGGHLAATEKGEILYSFPRGLTRPPETRWWRRAGKALVSAVAGVGRFVVRAWVSVVLVGYALAFLVLLIALALKSDSDDGPSAAVGVVFRVIAEALFWTFHPFSPVYVSREPGWLHPRERRGRRANKVPFYEKVNRFVFGPRPPERDPREDERNVLAELRRQAGRVAPADVMRVTGLPREHAERLLLRLMVDYNGDVEATDTGAVIYKFKDLRATARAEEALRAPAPPVFWGSRSTLPPLTGNDGGSNALFVLVNGFNLVASGYALVNGLTLERIGEIAARYGEQFPTPLPPPDGVPLVFGLVPFAFSLALFTLPLARAFRRKSAAKKVGRENGWRGVLRQVLTGRRGSVIQTRRELAEAWIAAGGHPPSEQELNDAVRAAGGEIDVGEDGQVIYKFDMVEGELRATQEDRRRATADEASPGEVVFSSEDDRVGRQADARAAERAWDDAYARSSGRPPAAPPAAAPSARPARPALPERGETIPGGRPAQDDREETAEELLARIGVDTRRRGG